MSLHALRQEILDIAASTGVTTFDHVPERLSPPSLIVLPGSPYIEPGDTFCTFKVNHTLSVVVPNGTNEKTTEDMDNLIETVLTTLVKERVSVESVSTFYVLDSGGAQYLAVDISVNDNVALARN